MLMADPERNRASMTETQDKTHKKTQSLIDRNEEKARQNHHNHYENGRNHGFTPSRPSNLASFGSDILKECKGIRHSLSMQGARTGLRSS
jgi:hypothetical protein